MVAAFTYAGCVNFVGPYKVVADSVEDTTTGPIYEESNSSSPERLQVEKGTEVIELEKGQPKHTVG